MIFTHIFTFDRSPPAWTLIWTSIPFCTKIWTVSESNFLIGSLTLVFLLVQVSPFSVSDILRLRLFGRVGSPASLLSTTMPTSSLVSVRAVPSTFSLALAFMFKSLGRSRFDRLRMTKRFLQLLPCTFKLINLTFFPLRIWVSWNFF